MVKKYRQFNEGVSRETFHFTKTYRLEDMLNSNRITASVALGTASDFSINKEYPYYISLSTTRSSKIGYGASVYNGLVRLNMNGDKINNNHKTISVDYWQRPRDPKNALYSGGSGQEKLNNMSRNDELEERILLEKPFIGPLNKLVDSISVMVDKTEGIPYLIECKKIADKINIPIYFYTDINDFDYEKVEKAIDIKSLLKEGDIPKEKRELSYLRFEYKLLPFIIYKNEGLLDTIADGMVKIPVIKDLLNKKDMKDIDYKNFLTKSFKEFESTYYIFKYYSGKNFSAEKIWSDFYITDFYSALSSDIHNHKSDSDDAKIYVFDLLVKDMRKYKTKSLKDYVIKKISL